MRLSAAPAATGARASGRFRHARDRRSWADRRGRPYGRVAAPRGSI